MNKELIEQLKTFFNVKWVKSPFNNNGSGWFLLEISPTPPLIELEFVVSDIIHNRVVDVSLGQVRHSLECLQKHHVPSYLKKLLPKLREQTFLVAVHGGNYGVYQGQPIAIAIKPEISYSLYPDHPHLNVGNPTKLDGQNIYIPDSFCYTDNPIELGSDPFQRLLKAFSMISVWLFRHQIWLLTRDCLSTGEWIGPEAEPLKPEEYPKFLNPNGFCRCGKQQKYIDCHMHSDLEMLSRKETITNKRQYILNSIHNWIIYKDKPQQYFLNEFRKLL